MLYCDCPLGTDLPDIPAVTCPENFGQIQKVVFQRLMGKTAENSITVATAKTLGTWTALLAAKDATKMVVSPYIAEPTVEAGEALTYGGGNATPGGVVEILGSNSTPFTGKFLKTPQAVIKVLKQFMCEVTGGLGVYLINGNGQIAAIKDGENYKPIPVESLFVGDRTIGGLEAPDTNVISWSFKPNWSDNLEIFKPDFNPLTQLVPAPSGVGG